MLPANIPHHGWGACFTSSSSSYTLVKLELLRQGCDRRAGGRNWRWRPPPSPQPGTRSRSMERKNSITTLGMSGWMYLESTNMLCSLPSLGLCPCCSLYLQCCSPPSPVSLQLILPGSAVSSPAGSSLLLLSPHGLCAPWAEHRLLLSVPYHSALL